LFLGVTIMRFVTKAVAALALAIPSLASAAPTVQINFPTSLAIPGAGLNEFHSQLSGLGYANYASSGASMILSDDAWIEFWFMGSESGFSDTFTAGPLSLTETSWYEDHFASPVYIGGAQFTAGSLLGKLVFSSNAGVTAGIGHDGFGIFLKAAQTTGQGVSEFYLGYDDQIGQADDNHDDFVVRVLVSAVPEPGTWAMLMAGFAIVGSLLRRRKQGGVAVLA
jgi:PEP-CTERM motif